jgi:hypothetical protein
VLPKRIVKHLYEKRVIHDGMSADAVADMVHSVLTSKKSRAFPAKDQRQMLARVKEKIAALRIITENAQGDTILIASYPKTTGRILEEARSQLSSLASQPTAQNASQKLTQAQAEAALQPLRAVLGKNAPKITVVQSESDLPAPYREEIRKAQAEGEVEGGYDAAKGEVYLIADRHRNAEGDALLFKADFNEQDAKRLDQIQRKRRQLIPFYSWMEVNFEYHANVFRNLLDVEKQNQSSSSRKNRITIESQPAWRKVDAQSLRALAANYYEQNLKGTTATHPKLGLIEFRSSGLRKMINSSADTRKTPHRSPSQRNHRIRYFLY